MKVLIVEDDQHMIDVLLEELAEHDVTVCTAVGPAIDAVRRGDFAVLLADWDLGLGGCGMDVIDAAPGDTSTILWSAIDRTHDIRQRGGAKMPGKVLVKTDILGAIDAIEAAA